MSNTQLRLISAFVMIALVATAIIAGNWAVFLFVGVCSLIAIDEIHTNILKCKRFGPYYFISQLIFIIPALIVFYLESFKFLLPLFIYGGVAINLVLIIYLFYFSIDSLVPVNFTRKNSFIAGILVAFPMMCLFSILELEQWQKLMAALLVVNFSMDSGAWFFGKNFGKHKLWERVSPKKTIEGLIGGMLTSGVAGGTVWHLMFGVMSFELFAFFCFLGGMSHLGDLIQSKIKRQCEIKDSSSLIPGHGGVYDRIDSLLFLAPFFTVALNYFYFY